MEKGYPSVGGLFTLICKELLKILNGIIYIIYILYINYKKIDK